MGRVAGHIKAGSREPAKLLFQKGALPALALMASEHISGNAHVNAHAE